MIADATGQFIYIADTGNNRIQKWMVQAGP